MIMMLSSVSARQSAKPVRENPSTLSRPVTHAIDIPINPGSLSRPVTYTVDIPKEREVIPEHVYQNGYSSPFMDACANGDVKKMKRELKNSMSYGDNPLKPNVFEKTPLMVTAAAGHLDAAQYLLKMIQDGRARKHYIDRQNENGHTALMMAAREGRLDMVKFLCQHDASLIKTNHKKQTALEIARANGHGEVEAFLKQKTKRAYLSRNLSWSPMGSVFSSPVVGFAHSVSLPLERRKGISGLSEVFASPEEESSTTDVSDWSSTTTTTTIGSPPGENAQPGPSVVPTAFDAIEAKRPANPFHTADKPSSSRLMAPAPRRSFREPHLSLPCDLLESPPGKNAKSGLSAVLPTVFETIEAERPANPFSEADKPSSSRWAAPIRRRPFREPSLSPPRDLLESPSENKATPPVCLPLGPIGFFLSKLFFPVAP